jgi:hypothetical protein
MDIFESLPRDVVHNLVDWLFQTLYNLNIRSFNLQQGHSVAQQKQLGVALPPDLRTRLEAASATAGKSIADEIRQRVRRTFEDDDFAHAWPATERLLNTIAVMTLLASLTTGKRWDEDPATAYLLQLALVAQLDRRGAKECAEIVPSEKFRRDGLVASTDPRVIAIALETLADFDDRDGQGRLDLKKLRAAFEASQPKGDKS